MHRDFLIIGQGIAGTLLSYELMRLGKRVMVIDRPAPFKSSLVAGAVLNPMAGKHWSPAPLAGVFIPAAVNTYRRLEALLGQHFLKETHLEVFHSSDAEALQFEKQAKAFPRYFSPCSGTNDTFFRNDSGAGTINGLYLVDGRNLLRAWRTYLEVSSSFMEDTFDWNRLRFSDEGVGYNGLTAGKVICCTGAAAMDNPFFRSLPFTANRGEALLVAIPGLPGDAVYHKRLRLIPRGSDEFWLGSNYTWNFRDLSPDAAWRADAEAELEHWLRIPFRVTDHIVAARPTTAGQFPFAGLHPANPALAIFNGLGTRGFSSGPFLASGMAQLLSDPSYNIPHYDRSRFEKAFK